MNMKVLVSHVSDGSMRSLVGGFDATLPARHTFLERHGVQAEDTVLVRVAYEGDDYCRYVTVGEDNCGDGITRPPEIISDALLTKERGVALLLPLADCAPLVLFDEQTGVIMLSHLGRHSVEQFGAKKSVDYFIKETGASPASLKAWLGPAAGAANYPLWAFQNRGLHDVITEHLLDAGLSIEQIDTKDAVDTTTHADYFSHSNFLKGLQNEDGRFAVVAVME